MNLILTRVLAGAIALADKFISQWVTISAPINTSTSVSNCFTAAYVTANVNGCGTEFITNLTKVITELTYFAPTLLAGLFAVQS